MKRETAMYHLKDGQKKTFTNVIWSAAPYIDKACTELDRKSTRLNSSHPTTSRMPSSA